ncbi:MAG: hypothetical protein WHS83_15700 [Chloroflexus sp.]|uniref:hypothetical protein n=1 Tax=Chloroflexus sp. TaxID=1904827 RepID=UPI0021DB973A|nr:MAG: hypothetical protein KatS3mg056_3228 [Chloroflexus sp.]
MDRKRIRKWIGWGTGVFIAVIGLFLIVIGARELLVGDAMFGAALIMLGAAVVPATNPFRLPSNNGEGRGTE